MKAAFLSVFLGLLFVACSSKEPTPASAQEIDETEEVEAALDNNEEDDEIDEEGPADTMSALFPNPNDLLLNVEQLPEFAKQVVLEIDKPLPEDIDEGDLQDEFKDMHGALTWDHVVRNIDRYVGRGIVVSGTIKAIVEAEDQSMIHLRIKKGTPEKDALIQYPSFLDFVDNDNVEVFGYVLGTSPFGGLRDGWWPQVHYPKIIARWILKKKKKKSYSYSSYYY